MITLTKSREASFRWQKMFVRIDFIQNSGDFIKMIEVKSKSCDPKEFYDSL
jgi:Holliday junction resolvase-like predicted endonuclease